MQSVPVSSAAPTLSDAALLARVASMRESVRGHKQHALALWEAYVPEEKPTERPAVGRFTKQLAYNE